MKLQHRQLAVMRDADGEPITESEEAAPYILSAGLGEEVAGFKPAEQDEAIWLLGWRDGLTVALCLKLNNTPDPLILRKVVLEMNLTPSFGLIYMEPANEHPC